MKQKSKKIVLDVNTWISIFLGGYFKDVRSFVGRKTTILRSQKLEDELKKVLAYQKFDWDKPIGFYMKFFYQFTVFAHTENVFTLCPDENDNYLFDLAIQAQADYLVSGDRAVLKTPIPPPTKVISYIQFREMFL